MRASRIHGWSVAVILAAVSAALPTRAGGQNLSETAASGSALGLVVGDGYTIRAERHGAVQRFTGNLVKLNDRWLVLRSVAENRREYGVPVLAKIPVLGHAFTKSSVGQSDEFLWIPREAATVEKRTPAASPPPVIPTLAEAPPAQTTCAVELAVADKVVRRLGGLEAVKDGSLTLSVPKKVSVPVPPKLLSFRPTTTTRQETHYDRQQLARADILCVRIPNYDPTALVGHAR